MTTPQLTCDETQALMADALDGTLGDAPRRQYDAHLASCAACRALEFDLARIRDGAASLPTLSPPRDLWAGIEARLETPVVSIAGRASGAVSRWTVRQLAAAAVVLVTATAGSTWLAVSRMAPGRPIAAERTAPLRAELVSAADESGIKVYEREIGELRGVLIARRSELDTATVSLLERNLTLIDRAIAESKAALAADPASAFLAGRLNRAYDTKLALLRSAALLPSRT